VGVLLSLIGSVTGIIVFYLAHQWVDHDWILIIPLFGALVLEELRMPQHRSNLLEAMTLMTAFLSDKAKGKDIITILTDSLPDLPAGYVSSAVQETIYLHRGGLSIDKCLLPLRKTNPFLDEFVLNLEHAGRRPGPALDLALETLLQRARSKWDQTSQALRVRIHAQPYVFFGRGVVFSGIFVILAFKFFPNVSLDRLAKIPGWLLFVTLGILLIFQLLFTNRWLRQAALVVILVAGIILGTSHFIPQLDLLLHRERVTHLPLHTSEPMLLQGTLVDLGTSKPIHFLVYKTNPVLSCIKVSDQSDPRQSTSALSPLSKGPTVQPSQTPASTEEESWRIELSQPK
jgi:hypothetical protein